jgi:hypothetical protein
MRTDHIERFNKASAGYRADCEQYIRDCESELKRARAILDTVKIAEALVVPEGAEKAHLEAVRVRDLKRPSGDGRPQPRQVIEMGRGDPDKIERELSATIEEVLNAG